MISQDIKNIISAFETVQSDYAQSSENISLCDRETQDILHSLELDNLAISERNKMATRLRRVRIQRRENKDVYETTEPVVTFLASDKGRQMVNLLREVLGKTRKIEEYHQRRTYRKKVKEGETL